MNDCGKHGCADKHIKGISCSVKNTAAQLATATMIRLLFFSANKTATARPIAPLIILSVADSIAGNVMAVRQAAGT